MQRLWLKSYPPGVPAEVDVDAFHSIVDIFEQSVTRYAERPAYVQMGESISFAKIDQLSRAFATYLKERLGLERGARVALMMPNILQYPVALFGALRAGCTVVNCSPLYTAYELERQLLDSGAETIVLLENFAAVLQQTLPQTKIRHVIVTRLGDLLSFAKRMFVNFVVKHVKRLAPPWRIPGAIAFNDTIAIGSELPWRGQVLRPEDIALLQYTGGTTGTPKGAILTHRNIVANLVQHQAFLSPALQEGADVALTAIPFFHIYALTVSCFLPFMIGATNVLIADPRDLRGLVREFSKHRITCFAGVNRLFAALVDDPAFARLDFSKLSIAASGGSPLVEHVATKWKAITGKTLIEAYGLTETSPVVTCNPVDLQAFNASCGIPLPSTDISIRGEDDAELPVGEAGELLVRGPQVMKEYWNQPDETAKAMTSDGFFRTGDIATIDARGFVRIVDRKKDMINVAGLKVYPNEVEEVIAMHPGVADVCAFGVPDEKSGERVKVVVVRRDPTLESAELEGFCRKYLAAYKVPRHVEFKNELPKTPLGKTLRRVLRSKSA